MHTGEYHLLMNKKMNPQKYNDDIGSFITNKDNINMPIAYSRLTRVRQ